jgi:hypothetical protein
MQFGLTAKRYLLAEMTDSPGKLHPDVAPSANYTPRTIASSAEVLTISAVTCNSG